MTDPTTESESVPTTPMERIRRRKEIAELETQLAFYEGRTHEGELMQSKASGLSIALRILQENAQ